MAFLVFNNYAVVRWPTLSCKSVNCSTWQPACLRQTASLPPFFFNTAIHVLRGWRVVPTAGEGGVGCADGPVGEVEEAVTRWSDLSVEAGQLSRVMEAVRGCVEGMDDVVAAHSTRRR